MLLRRLTVLAIDWNRTERMESLPRHALRISDPILVRFCVAALRADFCKHRAVNAFDLTAHCSEFRGRVDLQTQVVHTEFFGTLGHGEIDARVIEHPFRIVRLANRGLSTEQRRVKADALIEIGDGNVNVEAFHAGILLRVVFAVVFVGVQEGLHISGLSPQQFSVRYAMSPFIVSKFALYQMNRPSCLLTSNAA